MMCRMTANVQQREYLGEIATARRLELRLSKEEAARRAGVSVKTWTAVETGQKVRGTTYIGVEDALEWERGSVTDIFDGNDPTPLPSVPAEEKTEVDKAVTVLELIRNQYGEEVYRAAIARLDREQGGSGTSRRDVV